MYCSPPATFVYIANLGVAPQPGLMHPTLQAEAWSYYAPKVPFLTCRSLAAHDKICSHPSCHAVGYKLFPCCLN